MRRTHEEPRSANRQAQARLSTAARRNRRHIPLQVEQLETRAVPTTIVPLQVEPLATRAVPTTIVLGSSKDNTLYQSTAGNLSNGAGEYFFTGRTMGGSIRRGLIAFDVASRIPAGSTIDSVSLRLTMSRTVAGTATVALRKVLADWGEGTSDAGGQEGRGAPATPNDATWVHRFFNTVTWSSPGGEFAATASASVSVGGGGAYRWGSTEMVADVQAWLDDPASNFGWLVQGNEAGSRTAKRFDTKERTSAATRPVLTISYTPPRDLPADLAGRAAGQLPGAWLLGPDVGGHPAPGYTGTVFSLSTADPAIQVPAPVPCLLGGVTHSLSALRTNDGEPVREPPAESQTKGQAKSKGEAKGPGPFLFGRWDWTFSDAYTFLKTGSPICSGG